MQVAEHLDYGKSIMNNRSVESDIVCNVLNITALASLRLSAVGPPLAPIHHLIQTDPVKSFHIFFAIFSNTSERK